MKYLLVTCMLMMALQPMPLQACDMDADQEAPHHAAMQESAAHDCCDTDTEEADHVCNDAAQCGSCALGISLMSSGSNTVITVPAARYLDWEAQRHAAPPAHPPFRPPIA